MLPAWWERVSGWAKRWLRSGQERLNRKAAALPEDKVLDLVFLHEQGFVQARATGHSITRVYGEVHNRVSRRLRVRALPGTCFVARGSHQNMVTRCPFRFTLEPGATATMGIEASCLNAARPIPRDTDRFDGVRLAPEPVVRFLEAAQRLDAMTVQAGVWALTDDYTERDVQQRLVQRDRFGPHLPAVTADQVDDARDLLGRLGLPNRL